MNSESNKAVMRQVITALEQGDWATIEQHPGLYETRQHFPHMLAAFPDMRHTIETEVVAGDMITTVVTARGTHRGTFMGIAPTGKQVSFMVMGLDQIENGKIVHHWALPDLSSLLQQIGATIQPGQTELA